MYKNLILLISSLALAQNKPKLVVGVVVDQMKMEYLYRFDNDFSPNGFKKLMKDGFTFLDAHYNYMPTYTAPGHASVYTGTTPAHHGIVGNNWYNKEIGKSMYCTDDDDVSILGNGGKKEGNMSPKNLKATTITDELKLQTQFKGKVFGVSLKDRGAILPAGHFADWAFWFSNSGEFISSTFYGDKLPEWVIKYNNEKKYEKYLNQSWNLLYPIEKYNESLIDDNKYEGSFKKNTPFFPYNLKEINESKDAEILRTSPFGNDLVFDFAKQTIENEKLGTDDITDFLCLSFSSTDYVGHKFGSRSKEVQDTYLRLDITIAELINYLDKKIGKNQYVLFLTADHAAAENPIYLKDNKYDVENLNEKNIEADIRDFLTQKYGQNLLEEYSNFNVFFNLKSIENLKLDIQNVKTELKQYLLKQKFVKNVYTEEEILAGSSVDEYLNRIHRGFDVKQNGQLVVLYNPGYMEYKAVGTTHGSPYSYDTHVPVIFFGNSIKKGSSYQNINITQIAPTLAAILKITLPNSTTSSVLYEVIKK